MLQAAPDHLYYVGRSGDVNSKIFVIELMHDALDTLDQRLRVFPLEENNEIARLAILRDQQSAPKWARHRVLKAFRPGSQALDRVHPVDAVDLLREFLDSTEIPWRRNITR